MRRMIAYFEQEDTTQPAEVFEDVLDATHPQLSGKLARIAQRLQTYGYSLGGGYIEKCHSRNKLAAKNGITWLR